MSKMDGIKRGPGMKPMFLPDVTLHCADSQHAGGR